VTGVADPKARSRPYEAMFLAFNKEARKTHEYLEEHVKALLEKVGAKVVRFHRWDQRQLAYEVKGQREGIFYLCYFESDPQSIATLKREAELSELLLRMLILALDRIPTEEEVRKRSTTAEEAMREGEELRGEGGFDGGGRGDRRRGRGRSFEPSAAGEGGPGAAGEEEVAHRARTRTSAPLPQVRRPGTVPLLPQGRAGHRLQGRRHPRAALLAAGEALLAQALGELRQAPAPAEGRGEAGALPRPAAVRGLSRPRTGRAAPGRAAKSCQEAESGRWKSSSSRTSKASAARASR
jgi:small subunit ribosomal protein S6